jgi:replication initiation protein RepC
MTQHLTHAGLPDDLTRWQLLRLVEVARRKLGLSKGAVSYLRLAIGLTADGDFAKGRICAFWASVTEIAASLGMERRQIARIEAELIIRGFIHKSSTDRSRRSGHRLRGVILHEFGINLAPLIGQALEIQVLAQKAIEEQIEAKSLRKQINKLFESIRKLGSVEAERVADALLPNHRPSTIQNFQRLRQVAASLEAVLSDFTTDVGAGEMSHPCDISTPPNTNLNQIDKTCRAENRSVPQPIRTTPMQVRLLASERFREYLDFYATGLGEANGSDAHCLVMAARDLAAGIGISSREWQQSCAVLGEERTALCLLIADRNACRQDKYQVRDIAAAFVGMVRKEARQSAVVDALLGELIAASRKGERTATQAWSTRPMI